MGVQSQEKRLARTNAIKRKRSDVSIDIKAALEKLLRTTNSLHTPYTDLPADVRLLVDTVHPDHTMLEAAMATRRPRKSLGGRQSSQRMVMKAPLRQASCAAEYPFKRHPPVEYVNRGLFSPVSCTDSEWVTILDPNNLNDLGGDDLVSPLFDSETDLTPPSLRSPAPEYFPIDIDITPPSPVRSPSPPPIPRRSSKRPRRAPVYRPSLNVQTNFSLPRTSTRNVTKTSTPRAVSRESCSTCSSLPTHPPSPSQLPLELSAATRVSTNETRPEVQSLVQSHVRSQSNIENMSNSPSLECQARAKAQLVAQEQAQQATTTLISNMKARRRTPIGPLSGGAFKLYNADNTAINLSSPLYSLEKAAEMDSGKQSIINVYTKSARWHIDFPGLPAPKSNEVAMEIVVYPACLLIVTPFKVPKHAGLKWHVLDAIAKGARHTNVEVMFLGGGLLKVRVRKSELAGRRSVSVDGVNDLGFVEFVGSWTPSYT